MQDAEETNLKLGWIVQYLYIMYFCCAADFGKHAVRDRHRNYNKKIIRCSHASCHAILIFLQTIFDSTRCNKCDDHRHRPNTPYFVI